MSSPPKTLRIFISSPGDVSDERDKARRVIESLQRHYIGARLQPVLWEDLALPATASFQETIDYLLQREPIDIAVFILWSRLGSPLGSVITRADGTPYRSGTEREFDVMLEAFEQSDRQRPVMLTYTREDESGFRQSLSNCPATALEELITQRKLAESFIQEQFKDAEGHNVRAFHSYREPVSFAQRLHTHLHQVLDELLGEDIAPRWLHEPYRGLEVFDIEHAPIFQGRDEETCDVLQRLRDQEQSGCAFAVIVGASGSGKSSLARAGVAAALTQHAYDDHVKVWRVVTIFPSLGCGDLNSSLVVNLADQLPELRNSTTALDDIASGLEKEPTLTVRLSLVPAFARAADAAGGPVRILLLVDQLEELWTDRRITDKHREQFLNIMEILARSGHITVLATLRSDFYPHAQRIMAFLRLKGDRGHYDLLPPGPAALHRLITEPARLAGLRFEMQLQTGRTLDQIILQDASRDTSVLPLLQYALIELYRERDSNNRELTFAAYQKLGGVEGALGKRAADTFGGLAPEVRAALPRILPQLVTIDVEGEQSAVRRRAPLSFLTDTEAGKTLTEALIAARFLTSDRQGETPIVSFAHEALLRRWDELSQWVASNREHLRLRARAEQSQQRWAQQQEDPSLLLPSGLPLAEGQILLRDAGSLLTAETTSYIERSIAHREAESRRERRIRTTAMAMSITAALIAIVAAFWINSERSTAKTEAANAKIQEGIAREARTKAESSAELLSQQKEELEILNFRSTSLLSEAAQSDRITARNLWNLGRHRDALAHWARSLDYEPQSALEINTILTHARTQSWHSSIARLEGHENSLETAAFSPDGTRIVTSSWDGTARLWDTVTGQSIMTLKGHEGSLMDAAFSPDGTRIVTASVDKTARLWDVTSGQCLATLSGHTDRVVSAEYSPDGTKILTASWDMTARQWDAATGQTLSTLTGHTNVVVSATYSPDGMRIATASDDMTSRLWDASTGLPLVTLTGHSNAVVSAVLSPDGTKIITASADMSAILWDTATGQSLSTLSGHGGTVENAEFSPDAQSIVTASADGCAYIWDATTGQQLSILAGHANRLRSAVFSPDGARILTASEDKTARLWDTATGHEIAKYIGHEGSVVSAAFSPDGSRIVTASEDRIARLWDATTKSEAPEFWVGDGYFANAAAFSPDGLQFVGALNDNTARLWDAATCQSIATCTGHTNAVVSAAFSPDGTMIVTASVDKTARLWHSKTGQPIGTFAGHDEYVQTAAFSPDGTQVVTASGDMTARLWDVTSGQLLTTLTGHEHDVVNAVFSPKGERIATASLDGFARLWDPLTGQTINSFSGHQGGVWGIAFSPDGTRMITTSDDKTARLWDVSSAEMLMVLTGHENTIWNAAFSSEGTQVATGSLDGTARLWDAETGQALTTLKNAFGNIQSVSFSPAGTRLLTTSTDGTAQLWDLIGVRSAPPGWFAMFLRYLSLRFHDFNGELQDWPASFSEIHVPELLQAIEMDRTRYGDIARYFLTPHPAKPTHPGSKVTCGEGADMLIRPAALKSEIERAYNWHPGHPLVQIAVARFEETTARAEFLREYGVSRLLKRLPSDREPASQIASLCRRAEALLLEQMDQLRANRVRERADELDPMR